MYREFLSPIVWPGTLRLRIATCDNGAFFDRSDTSITICYDYIAGFEKTAPKQGHPNTELTPDGITYDDVVTGSVVSALLHETGHALFYYFQIPVLGGEEDAADQIAAFTMLQFGRDLGRMMIKGTLWKWRSQAQDTNHSYWDEHSSPLQRFANFLCIAYGADQAAFKDLVGYLPKGREPGCRREYDQVHAAFNATVLPHVSQDRIPQIRTEVAKWILAKPE
jgi:hypothetical protein